MRVCMDARRVSEPEGWTALTVAAQNGHPRVIAALLSARAIDVNRAARIGWTALMIAAQNGE